MTVTYPSARPSCQPVRAVDMAWHDAAFATLPEASDWLDYLEGCEVWERTCSIVGEEFHVLWR